MGSKAIAVVDSEGSVCRGIVLLLRAHGHDAYDVEVATAAATILKRRPDRVLLCLEHDDVRAGEIVSQLREGGFGGQIIGVGEREWPIADTKAAARPLDDHWLKPLQTSQLLSFAASLAALV